MMFKERLKKSRESKGYSQTELAEFLSITRQAYNNYEMEKRTPSKESLVKLSKILAVSVDYLLGCSDDPSPKAINEQFKEIDFNLLEEIKDMTEEQKKDVLEYIRFKKRQKTD